MIKLSEMVRDDVAELREAIFLLPVEGCIKKYVDYIYKSDIEGFEKYFVNALQNHVKKFVESLLKKLYESYDKEKLLKLVLEWQIEGVYSLDCQFDNDSVDYIIGSYFTDVEAHEYIKEEMNSILDEVVAKARATKAEKEKIDLEVKRNAVESSIKSYKNSIERLSGELVEVEEKLKAYK